MDQLLRIVMEDRQAAREERQASLAALQQLTQIATNHANNNNGKGDPRSTLKDFRNTNPPVFSKTVEPLDADDWLRTIENNLEIAGVANNDKVMFSTHYLTGAARAWWESVRAIQAPEQGLTW